MIVWSYMVNNDKLAECTYEGVAVINVCHLLDVIYGKNWAGDFNRSYAETQSAIMAWCDANDSHYYARGREDFSRYEAVEEAKQAGKTAVVVEDLS